jgi:hypothetical protein
MTHIHSKSPRIVDPVSLLQNSIEGAQRQVARGDSMFRMWRGFRVNEEDKKSES